MFHLIFGGVQCGVITGNCLVPNPKDGELNGFLKWMESKENKLLPLKHFTSSQSIEILLQIRFQACNGKKTKILVSSVSLPLTFTNCEQAIPMQCWICTFCKLDFGRGCYDYTKTTLFETKWPITSINNYLRTNNCPFLICTRTLSSWWHHRASGSVHFLPVKRRNQE